MQKMASIRIIRKIVNRRLPSSLTSLTVGSSIGRDELSGKRLYSSSSICQATPRKNETVNPPEIKPKKRANEFSVDRSGLLKSEDLDFPNEFVEPVNRPDKEELTPLAIDLYSIINLKGPITLHEFMSEALNHTVHGYYQAKNTEKIGAKGDFVTSPEISQLFGEMLGIWIYSTWEAMGSPSTFHLIEFGPGKGTLMVDMLTVLRKFPKCLAAVEVHFVELSLRLRQVQYDSLQKKFSNKPETEFTNMTEVLKDQQRYEIEIEGTKVPLVWNSFFRQIPSDQPCIIIGQEFLDAFPVHQFIYTKKGWREKLVDIDRVIYNLDDDEEFDNSNNNNEPGEKKQPYPFHFRLVTSPRPTAAVQSLISSENPKVKQFRESLKTSGASFKSPDEAQLQEGDGLEIAPLALIQCEDVAMRITKAGGACLFIDYGEDFAQEDTLRGFKKHKQVPFLSEPGTVDITADVNFASCRKAAESKGAHVLPLMLQGQFLMNMGIVQRVQRLIEHPSVTDEDANFLVESMKKLVLPEEMGKRFKVLGIIHPTLVGKVYGF